MSSMCVRWNLLGTCELSNPFQTELAIDVNTVITDTHAVVADAHTVVSDTRTVVADTHTMVPDIHRSVLTGQEDTSGKIYHLVGATFRPSTANFLPSPRLKPGQRC